MLKTNFSKDALAALHSFPQKHARQIAGKIEQLALVPTSVPTKELKGSSGFFRAASGEYRIVVSIDGLDLRIWFIGKRNDDEIYKRFLRKK
jgi:mRNA interferase RelE/StbE